LSRWWVKILVTSFIKTKCLQKEIINLKPALDVESYIQHQIQFIKENDNEEFQKFLLILIFFVKMFI